MRKDYSNSAICKYFPCTASKETGRDCAKSDECETRKFFDKYGCDATLGIGAMTAEGLEAAIKQSE